MEGVSRIGPEDVKRLIDQRADFILLDVRSPDAYNASPVKIRGALRIPPSEVGIRADELPRHKSIVTY